MCSSGLGQFTNVDKAASYCGSSSHGRADQVSTPTGPLTAFEVAVGGGGAMLATAEFVRVHRQAHGAARLAPFKTGLKENGVQPFGFGLRLDQAGTWNDHGLLEGRAPRAAFGDKGGSAQFCAARVGARADKYPVELNVGDRLIGGQAHV